MCGSLLSQRVLSNELSARNFLIRPPEPAKWALISPPSESVYIGKTELLSVPFFWNSSKLVNPHLCVVGITGSGKSYFIKSFITRARLALGTSALILDWAGEYADWVRQAGGEVLDFSSGGINPLELSGSSPAMRSRQVAESLEILTDLSSFPRQRRLTCQAIEDAYKKRRTPTLETVGALLKKKARRDPDAAEAAHRIESLVLSSKGAFIKNTVPIANLTRGLCCVDLHTLPAESLRSLAGLAILQFVKEAMRLGDYRAAGPPKLFVVADEAWKIAADARSDVVSIVREGRKYGFGLIVASQNPTDVHSSIFSNSGTVMCFRLTLSSERAYVRSSLSYSDYYEQRSHSLSVGQALVHLEFASQGGGPKDFVVSRIDGEEPLAMLCIRGGKMSIELEKTDLRLRLLSFGLSEKQAAEMLLQFERKNQSLEASQFVALLERQGYPRAASISLLRELGGRESDLLPLFSSSKRPPQGEEPKEALFVLEGKETAAKKPLKKRRSAHGKR